MNALSLGMSLNIYDLISFKHVIMIYITEQLAS